jgi:hypothetical protein
MGVSLVQYNFSSKSGFAGAMGGALVGSPRHVRIFSIAAGEFIAHRILIRPPQRGQESTSSSNTLIIS